ncbi:DUF2336 domain-containing protein [Mesorhizobium sp. J428]|uniref:DUF2336 domain-containing protein n=1 Tax=Mesorhizobium sp. J428 TaxID=2898440 RepID=UPI0021513D39|nr:DUF2336 domain-containing protein [Mesorhizobium sp. J428]MCR5859279.1 DUF2336 domain-containing protein [Mesorhizobium sp. J428]
MIVQHFLKWIDTAKVAERAAAASALARAYVFSDLTFEDRCAAEAALTLLLDDPSPKVRLAMAESLSLCHHAPAQIIAALASDQPEIAALILLRSPLLADSDLVDRVAGGSAAAQRLIAMRPRVSHAVSAALAETGDRDACLTLLRNDGADIAAISLRRIAERHGADAALREAMLSDRRLPADVHHMLMVMLGEALRCAPLVQALIGPARAERITRDACLSASVRLIETTPAEECAALVEHLRLRGEMTSSFLVRIVAYGKIDFFGAALVALSGQKESRIRSLLADGRDVALEALFRTAGLAEATHRVILRAIKAWREVARGQRVAGPQEVSWLMLKELETDRTGKDGRLASLLSSIHLSALRENARDHAVAIQAA